MTGGIALSGQVLPVGGIRDRVLAAHRYDLPHAFGCDGTATTWTRSSGIDLFPVLDCVAQHRRPGWTGACGPRPRGATALVRESPGHRVSDRYASLCCSNAAAVAGAAGDALESDVPLPRIMHEGPELGRDTKASA